MVCSRRVEEPKESSIMVVQVIDELFRVGGALGVGVAAGPGVAFWRHAEEDSTTEDEEGGGADSVVGSEDAEEVE